MKKINLKKVKQLQLQKANLFQKKTCRLKNNDTDLTRLMWQQIILELKELNASKFQVDQKIFSLDLIVISVKDAIPKGKVKKGAVHKAVVVRTRKEIYRDDGSKVQFDTNAVVLTDEKGEPIGTRIFGPVTRELRTRGHTKIISLAPGTINDFKKGTPVKILVGKDKGKTGEILEINRKLNKIKVKSINMIKAFKTNKGKQGRHYI